MLGLEQSKLSDMEQFAAVREFNRFYTARLGLLRKRYLGGEFSFTEARVLYEIGAAPQLTASLLRRSLELDAGYISRLLASLTKRKLVRQTTSTVDDREKQLTLTPTGEKVVARLNEQSISHLQTMLANVSANDRQTLVASLLSVRKILAGDGNGVARIERLTVAHADALKVLQEYYKAVRVVQRDNPKTIQKIIEEPSSGMWLAYLNEEVVGCVVLRKLESIPFACECKRLYVKPAARGKRIADKLLDAQEAYARSQNVKWIYLDSHDDLKTAIALYERRGYQRCERYNNNPQATVFMRKKIT